MLQGGGVQCEYRDCRGPGDHGEPRWGLEKERGMRWADRSLTRMQTQTVL